MRAQLRIVSGSLRGRKLSYTIHPSLRPIPDMVRQALFNILAGVVAGRPFFDLFAGTGIVGFEALSRGAEPVEFVERDVRVAGTIVKHLHDFGSADKAHVQRADVYRWAERWQAPGEPVTIFMGPPFSDFERCPLTLVKALSDLQGKVAPGSVLVLQSEKTFVEDHLDQAWDVRSYGRNQLAIWINDRA